MLKKISWFLVLVSSFLIHSNVFATKYYDSFNEQMISNEFINTTKDGVTKYQQMTLIVRNSDKKFVYCIEPGSSIDDSKILTGNDFRQDEIANLTMNQWERIRKIAYYGYGYKDHTDIKWYIITQFMIWQTNNLGYDIYFTDKLNGNRIEKYTQEIIELENLVKGHNVISRFNTDNLEMFWGETKSFIDKNNVLSKFEITIENNIDVTTSGNQLTIKSNNYGNSTIIFHKEEKRFGNKAIVYADDTYQDLLLPGDLDSVSFSKKVKINYGTISIQKIDSNTIKSESNNHISLENSKYGLYNENDNLIEEQITNQFGKLTFDTKLNSNVYYVKEISPSIGYQLDNTKYYVEINKDNYNVNLNVFGQVIKENFEIIKVLENNKTGLLEFEKGIEFGIYDLNNNLIKTYITDDLGTINFSLEYGKYIIKQHTSYEDYEKITDFEIDVRENNKNNKYIFKDSKIIYKVNLKVINKDTKENIENIKFEIYDNNNKKICNNENECIYKTDKNGNIEFPQNFDFGKYKIKLMADEKFKYIFDEDNLTFIIDENTKYKEIENCRVVELIYYLKLKDEDTIIEKTKNYPEEEIIPISSNEPLISENEMIVEVPNTLANDYYIYVILICIFFITIKKYF